MKNKIMFLVILGLYKAPLKKQILTKNMQAIIVMGILMFHQLVSKNIVKKVFQTGLRLLHFLYVFGSLLLNKIANTIWDFFQKKVVNYLLVKIQLKEQFLHVIKTLKCLKFLFKEPILVQWEPNLFSTIIQILTQNTSKILTN